MWCLGGILIKRKCPFCGGSDVAEILYGLPAYSDEFERALANHKIVLGGCCITGGEPAAHCNSCGKDFGKPPYARRRRNQPDNEARELLPDVITGIVFSEGGFTGNYDHVEIKAEKGIYVSSYMDFPYFPEPCTRVITGAQWKRLMDGLFTKLCIHEWKHKYINPYVLDGTHWSLELKLTGRRRYTICGSNAYPALYRDLVRLFKPFMKKEERSLE